jgi:tetratricopeptide (TPR) repeat protein
MKSAKRDLERCAELTAAAAGLQRRGRLAGALTFYTEALDIAEKLAHADPADDRPIRQRARILYALGALHIDADRWNVAVTVLEESEKAYRELAGRGADGIEPLIADVKARRASARALGGRGASAVLEVDEAVSYHRSLPAGQQTAGRSLDMARILTSNAVILDRFGDPDLAVASADRAIRLYTSLADAINAAPDLDFQFEYLLAVADVAARIHSASGRLDRALEADDLAIHAARALATAGSASEATALAVRLTRKGLHLRAAGRPAQRGEATTFLAEGSALDAAAALLATAEWEQLVNAGPPVTLAMALESAELDLGRGRVRTELLDAVVGPAAGCGILSPSGRCSEEAARTQAGELAGIAIDLLPRSADPGLRIGLEAHYLFAVGTRRDAPVVRHQFDSSGIPWARLLMVCCQVLDGMKEEWVLPLALDLASWNFGVIVQLQPFVMTVQRYLKTGKPLPGDLDTSVVELVRDCLSLHAALHLRNGDDDAAQQIRQIAKLLGTEF